MPSLKHIVDSYMAKVPGIEEHCNRCLNTARWGGSVVLMVVDAAFTSIGLNYFVAVVPKVNEFSKKFVENGKITCLRDLASSDPNEMATIWKNRRSWSIARNISSYLATLGDDRTALRMWARRADLQNWREDPIGKIKGVGVVTFQYLRMMGGIDTVMPDKIVKKVINGILKEAGQQPIDDNLEFVKKAEEVAANTGYRPIELCWMTWMIQPEGKMIRMTRYAEILPKI